MTQSQVLVYRAIIRLLAGDKRTYQIHRERALRQYDKEERQRHLRVTIKEMMEFQKTEGKRCRLSS